MRGLRVRVAVGPVVGTSVVMGIEVGASVGIGVVGGTGVISGSGVCSMGISDGSGMGVSVAMGVRVSVGSASAVAVAGTRSGASGVAVDGELCGCPFGAGCGAGSDVGGAGVGDATTGGCVALGLGRRVGASAGISAGIGLLKAVRFLIAGITNGVAMEAGGVFVSTNT